MTKVPEATSPITRALRKSQARAILLLGPAVSYSSMMGPGHDGQGRALLHRRMEQADSMGNVEDALREVLEGLPEQITIGLIQDKLAAQGVNLSDRDLKQVARRLHQGKHTFTLKGRSTLGNRYLSLELTDGEISRTEQRFKDFIENRLPDVIRAAAGKVSQMLLADLKRRWNAEHRLQCRELNGFRKRLYALWREPLEALRMLLTIAREFGGSILSEVTESLGASSRRHLIEVLGRLHARACQISDEVIYLLEGGFADGAMARWRSLHEVAVVALLVAKHGEDLAERYILHQAVESQRAAEEYTKCQPRLGYEPLRQTELTAIRKAYDGVIARFGADFKHQFGWAAHHLKDPSPRISNLEQAAGIDHLRSHYRLASHNVHANPKGVYVQLGLLNESQLLLAGPSDIGLPEPGQCAALSLTQISAAIVALAPNLDHAVILQIMVQLEFEIAEAFAMAHQRLIGNGRRKRSRGAVSDAATATERRHDRALRRASFGHHKTGRAAVPSERPK